MSRILPVKIDEGTGTPLVFLHGLGNNHRSWSYVLEHIDRSKYRIIALDLLGFGDAPKPDIAYTPQAHAESVVATLDTLNIGPAVIAGHSMGCLVALRIAHDHPDRVIKLALFGAPVYREKPSRRRWLKLLRKEGAYFAVFDVVKNNPDAVQAGGAIADELVPFIKGLEITPATWPAYKSSLEHTIMNFESYEIATHIERPALFVNGLLDVFVISKNIAEIRRTNKKYISSKRVLGPHEITPRQGRVIAKILKRL